MSANKFIPSGHKGDTFWKRTPYPFIDNYDGAEHEVFPASSYFSPSDVSGAAVILDEDISPDGNGKSIKIGVENAGVPTSLLPNLGFQNPLIESRARIWQKIEFSGGAFVQSGLVARGTEDGGFYIYLIQIGATTTLQFFRLDGAGLDTLFQKVIPVVSGDIVGLEIEVADGVGGPSFIGRANYDGESWTDEFTLTDTDRPDLIGAPGLNGIFLIGDSADEEDGVTLSGFKIFSQE